MVHCALPPVLMPVGPESETVLESEKVSPRKMKVCFLIWSLLLIKGVTGFLTFDTFCIRKWESVFIRCYSRRSRRGPKNRIAPTRKRLPNDSWFPDAFSGIGPLHSHLHALKLRRTPYSACQASPVSLLRITVIMTRSVNGPALLPWTNSEYRPRISPAKTAK